MVGKLTSLVWLRTLKSAARAAENGETLDGALRTAASAYE
jgi:hypothetical protein